MLFHKLHIWANYQQSPFFIVISHNSNETSFTSIPIYTLTHTHMQPKYNFYKTNEVMYYNSTSNTLQLRPIVCITFIWVVYIWLPLPFQSLDNTNRMKAKETFCSFLLHNHSSFYFYIFVFSLFFVFFFLFCFVLDMRQWHLHNFDIREHKLCMQVFSKIILYARIINFVYVWYSCRKARKCKYFEICLYYCKKEEEQKLNVKKRKVL